jgi:asparagine synthase (glutamine-hydrolysing)
MCGIAAMFAQRGEVSEEGLLRAREALRHRGPDDEGVWLAADRRVGLAHTRLSIIDLESGQQPIASEDGSIIAVVNGELYDFEETQRELEARGHRLRTRTDSEILVHLYEELGTHALHRLKGEYAFVLWDGRRRVLWAARDRFGVKPLVYAVTGDRLTIASEIKALFAAGVPAAWDAEAVLQSCFVGTADRTLFRGVRSVPPGCVLRATETSVGIHRYWELALPRGGAEAISEQEAVRGIRERLETAVKRRLRADVPVSVYLSGGLDSSAILGMAAAMGQPLTGFTIAFEDDPQPEEACARAMAAHSGCEIEVLPITQQMLADAFAGAARAAETMMMNAHGVGKYLLSRRVRERGRKVVLTGEGADELFAGYPVMRFDHLKALHGDEAGALAELRATNAASVGLSLPSAPAASPHFEVVRRVLGEVPGFFAAFAEAGEVIGQLFAGGAAMPNPFLGVLEDVDVRGQLAGADVVARSIYLLSATILPTYILTVLGDRMEMAHSIEGRVPFLDHELAEYVARIPSALKIGGGIEKKVLRDAVRDLIPDSIYRRAKHPLRAPVSGAGPMWQMLQDVVHGDTLRQLPFIDAARARAFAEARAFGPGAAALNCQAVVLTRLASLCALQDAFHPS